MLTRLRVDGFKSLVAVDVRFGPFTCMAGPNGAGKSNLFDAIAFLATLAEQPLMDAAAAVRGAGVADVRGLFHRSGDHVTDAMSFEADLVVPPRGRDDWGQEVAASATLLRYRLTLGRRDAELHVVHESLESVPRSGARAHFAFEHDRSFAESVGVFRRGSAAFITTVGEGRERVIGLRPEGRRSRGRREAHAERLPRTLLSSAANVADGPTAVLARREMQRWRLLQLEPSALRSPDPYAAPTKLDRDGAHVAATLARLIGVHPLHAARTRRGPTTAGARALAARVANRLAAVVPGVSSVTVDVDPGRELLSLVVHDLAGTPCEARRLSDGALRLLALAVLEEDMDGWGLACLEEPENGIHPEHVPTVVGLLRDMAVDPTRAVGPDNPLRQVIVNTHSPEVVAYVPDDALVLTASLPASRAGRLFPRTSMRWLSGTWRTRGSASDANLAGRGHLLAYLDPLGAAVPERPFDGGTEAKSSGRRRVMDRPELRVAPPMVYDRER